MYSTEVELPDTLHRAISAEREEWCHWRRRCWSLDCQRTAWLRDWAGWKWCLRHWWRNVRWGGGSIWRGIMTVEVFYWRWRR
jgi:hypothetical protein